jgi:hypothetical protein
MTDVTGAPAVIPRLGELTTVRGVRKGRVGGEADGEIVSMEGIGGDGARGSGGECRRDKEESSVSRRWEE